MTSKAKLNEESRGIAKKALFVNLLDPANIPFDSDYANELKKGAVGVENVTTTKPWFDAKEALSDYADWLNILEKNRNALHQVRTFGDIKEARAEGKTGIILGTQGARMLGEDLKMLRAFYNLGLRVMGITYQRRGPFGDGCGEPKDGGLSQLGERLVAEANKLGIIIDLSHAGRGATMETLRLSKDPVIVSHSNAKALCDHVRNLDDEEMKALAENGGVIGVVAYGVILVKGRRGTLEDWFNHLDYIEKQVGVNHIGVGLDAYPPTPAWWQAEFKRQFPEIAGAYPYEVDIEGLSSPAEWRNVIPGLLERGYSEDDIIKILGGNALRVFERVWKT